MATEPLPVRSACRSCDSRVDEMVAAASALVTGPRRAGVIEGAL
jgi:hypothetical protein